MKINNIVIFLNGERGIEILQNLLQENRNIVAIVAPEKSCFWEGKKDYFNQILIKATQINHPTIIEKLTVLNPDIFIVAGFPTIFKRPILDIPRLGVLNLHGGPLPKYRGGSPLNWQIINGEKQIGISVIAMNEGIDTGDILDQAFFELKEIDDINTVHQKANSHFITLVSNVFSKFENNQLCPQKQNEQEAQYWTQRCEQDSFIDWNIMTAQQVINMVRALKTPYPNAFTYLNNQKIFIHDAVPPPQIIKGRPAKVIYLRGVGPYIICKDKAILIKKCSAILKNGVQLNV